MPKLVIVDPIVAAGGVERSIYWLVKGMMDLPEFSRWRVTVVIPRVNTYRAEISWPEWAKARNVRIRHIRDDIPSRLVDWYGARTSGSGRIWERRGTWKIQRFFVLPLFRLLIRHSRLSGHPGEVEPWIERFIRLKGFDVAHFPYPYFWECPDVPLPIVCSAVDFAYRRIETCDASLLEKVDRSLPEWFERSSYIVANSRFTRNELRDLYPGFEGKTRIVRLGVYVPERAPSEAETGKVRQRLGIRGQFILSVAGIARHKNQKVIFEALGRLRRDGVNISLVCVGPHSERLRSETEARSDSYATETLDLAGNLGMVHGRDFFGLGYVDDLTLECLYREAATFVTASVYEGASMTPLEAMWAGCPVIMSGIPPHKEIHELVGGNAFLFDPDDPMDLARAIMEVLTMPEEAAEKAERAKEIVPRAFSWKKTGAGYLEVFSDAISRDTGS